MLIAIGLLAGCAKQSNAGEYYLIEKSHYLDKERADLCEKLVENFNQFKDEPPMVCELKFDPMFKDFTLPKWKKLDGLKHLKIIKRLQTVESNHPWDEDGIEFIKQKLKQGKYHLFQASVDINYDGHVNTVFKLTLNSCDQIRDYKYDIVGDNKYFAIPNFPDKNHPKGLGSLNGSVRGTLFLYKNRPFFHSWIQWPLFLSDRSRSVEGPSPRIAVYETSSPSRPYYESYAYRERCEIGYRK